MTHPQSRMSAKRGVGIRPAPVLNEEHPQPLGRRSEVVLRVDRTQHRIACHAGVKRVDEAAERLLSANGFVKRHRLARGHGRFVGIHWPHSPRTVSLMTTPRPETFDLIVVGLGPGGEEVAERMAEAGWSVLGI